MNSFDWNNLRYVLAVAKHGSAAAAARALAVSHATVLRRIQEVEQDLGLVLFERLPGGFRPTEAALPVLEMSEAIDTAITGTRRLIDGRAAELEGVVRFTTTDSLLDAGLLPLLDSFRARHPAIQLEMLVTNTVLDLDRRDADVTLRPALNPPEALVGMRLCRVDFAVYAAPAYLSGRAATPWTALDLLMPNGPTTQSPIGRWLLEATAPARSVLSANSFVALRRAAEAGMGVAALPCFVGRPSALLQHITDLPQAASSELWVLTHAHLRQSGRIRAFMAHLADGMRAQRSLFEHSDHEDRNS